MFDTAGNTHASLPICLFESVTIGMQQSLASAHSISLALASKSSVVSENVAAGISAGNASEAGSAARESVASEGSNVSGTLTSSERQQQQQQQQQQRVVSGPSIFKPRNTTKNVSKTP